MDEDPSKGAQTDEAEQDDDSKEGPSPEEIEAAWSKVPDEIRDAAERLGIGPSSGYSVIAITEDDIRGMSDKVGKHLGRRLCLNSAREIAQQLPHVANTLGALTLDMIRMPDCSHIPLDLPKIRQATIEAMDACITFNRAVKGFEDEEFEGKPAMKVTADAAMRMHQKTLEEIIRVREDFIAVTGAFFDKQAENDIPLPDDAPVH